MILLASPSLKEARVEGLGFQRQLAYRFTVAGLLVITSRACFHRVEAPEA